MSAPKNPAAVALGRLGGRIRSEKKAAAVRVNGAKGGRPPTDSLDRLWNLVAALAHPDDDHIENDLEDEAHDIIRELRDVLSTAPITTFMVRCHYCGHLPCDCTER